MSGSDPKQPQQGRPPETALRLQWLSGRYAVCRIGPHEVIPPWAVNARSFLSVTRTCDELSIVVEEGAVPETVREVRRGWSMLRIAGRLDFSLVGILAHLTAALADAEIPVFAISTHDTDYLLVPSDRADAATRALRRVATVEAPTA